MIAFFRLIRFQNLLLIILTQYLLRYFLILPAFTAEYFITGIFPEHLNNFNFAILVFATVMLAAGGYIINDYYDSIIDEINKPEKIIIGKIISEKQAILGYQIVTSIGILLGFYLSYIIEKPVMGFINLFVAASLWMYSTQLKKKLLVGNLVIAFLSALSLLVVGLFEPEFYRNFFYLALYSGFAFLVSLIREIIKDMEDITGDERGQVKSLPVRFGLQKTKAVVIVLTLLTASLLGFTLFKIFYTNTVLSFWNLLILFELPFIALLYLTANASQKKDYHFISQLAKGIMLLGILSLIPFYYYFIR